MGAIQSRSCDFRTKYSKYQQTIDSIESAHPKQVRLSLIEKESFTSRDQMEAVSIMIYEKAVLNPKLSLKCAHLVKELEAEKLFENDEELTFRSIFDKYLMCITYLIIDRYDDSKMTDYAVERGTSIATFIGHLFVVDALLETFLIEIGKAAKKKETRNCRFFIQTIWNVIAKRMQSLHGITYEMFEEMIADPAAVRTTSSTLNPEYHLAARFCAYLQKLTTSSHYELYEHFEDFACMQDDTIEIAVETCLEHSVIRQDFINVHRDISLEIHHKRPNELKTHLNNFLVEKIDQYRAPANLERNKNLATLILEFYNVGLVSDGTVDKFLAASRSSTAQKEIFNYVFVGVMTRYRGRFLRSYFDHSKKCADVDFHDVAIPAIEAYIQCRELQAGIESKHKNPCERTVADSPEFYEYASKCQTLRTAFDANNSVIQPTFICENRLSCHFASLRGLELLKRHIGNKFFTPERIEACTKLSAKSLKFNISNSVSDSIGRDMTTYMPYFNGATKLKRKVKNFSTLLAALFNAKLVNRFLIIRWLSELAGGKKTDFETFTEFFPKISTKLENENRYTWQIYSNMFYTFGAANCDFKDFYIFKEICSSFSYEVNAIDMMQLKMVTIPNVKQAMTLVSKHLLTLFSNRELSAQAIVQIIHTLTATELDKNLFRSEFQDALCTAFGNACSMCTDFDGKTFNLAIHVIDLIAGLCLKTFITRLGLANLLHVMVDIIDLNPRPIPGLMNYFNQHLSQFFIGTKALPTKVEKIIVDVKDKMEGMLKIKRIDCRKVMEVIAGLENILDRSRQKREQDEGKKCGKDKEKSTSSDPSASTAPKDEPGSSVKAKTPADSCEKLQNQETKLKSSSEPSTSAAVILREPATQKDQQHPSPPHSVALQSRKRKADSLDTGDQNNSSGISKSAACSSNESSTSTTMTHQAPKDPESQNSPSTMPKTSPKDYQDYCNYFDSIKHKTSDDDKFLFDSALISAIGITKKEQVIDLVKKFIDRVQAGQSAVIFFIQNVQKIGNVIQNAFKQQNQKVSFQKLLIEEVFLRFDKQERLLDFMCELYNNSFVNKAAMIAFVDTFKSQSPENIQLMHTFVRTCAIRLSSQGDKEQLIQIRTIAKSVKNLPNFDEDVKYLAQDLASSTSSLILLMENGQSKAQVLTESPEKLVDDLIKNVLKNPQIYVKTACRLDGKMKELLIKSIENIIKEVPDFVVKIDEFMNLLEFIAELYNSDFLKNEFMAWIIEMLMQSSTNEICSQFIEFLFIKCGQKMENENKHKLDIYMKYFEAVLAQNIDNVQSECFERIQKLKNRKWKILKVPENFYEDFLMLYSMNDAKVEELVEIFRIDEEEMDKFVLILWKIILKDPPHPSHSNLCLEISKSCDNFGPKLTSFLTARGITFIGLNADMFNENVKERLGKVMTFVAEIFSNNLASDQVLELFLDQKLASKLPSEFVTRIFSILSKCGRLDESQNDRLKNLVKDFDKMYHQGVGAQMESIIKGLKSIETGVN